MRGADTFTESLFTVQKLEDFVPSNHPLRPIREMVNTALERMDGLFSSMYAQDYKGGRPSIAPEKLLRAMLLQILYSVRSERMLMEQIQYNMLFRWFVGLAMDDSVWVPTVFSKNRERIIEHDAAVELFNQIVQMADERQLLSGEHFSVDGTLIQAWAGHKSFKPKDGGDNDDGTTTTTNSNTTTHSDSRSSEGSRFKGQKRSNATHQSSTDADARLYRKGNTASELRYIGHTLADNRHGLIANARVTQADGYAEREAAKAMIGDAVQAAPEAAQVTLGADKGYDAQEFVEHLQDIGVVPHIAQNTSHRQSAVPDAIAQTEGYAISQRKRKRIEQGFGWGKWIGQIRQVMVRGLERVDAVFVLTMTAYNLTRMRTLGEMLQGHVRLKTA